MFSVHCGTYKANSVAANTDLLETVKPANVSNFYLVGFEINCSVAAKIELNDTDAVYCAPAASGYSARVNMEGEFTVPVDKIKIVDACNVNALTFFYTGEEMQTLYPPAVFPLSGAYGLPIMVRMSGLGSIFYTTDGSNPTADSTEYTGPFELESAGTVKAISIQPGRVSSSVTSVTYTQAKAATPVATPVAGEIEVGSAVVLTCATVGAVIHYTIDGSAPGAGSPVYSAPIEISADTTIKALAIADGYTNSDVLTAAYTVAE